MQDLSVTTVQTPLHWEAVQANLDHFSTLLETASNTDLIVLPEMFTTGFTMNTASVAEPMDGLAMRWLATTAAAKQCVVTGSAIIEESGNYYNRLIWMRADGTFETYDKRHLFRFAKENDHFSGGQHQLQVELNGWQIRPLICYDLRFPVWARQQQHNHYDVLLYVANWPQARVSTWSTLLMARAMENQAYVVGVNRIGSDFKGIEYSGGTAVLDPKGAPIWQAPDHETSVQTTVLSRSALEDYKAKFPAWMDADGFSLR